MCGAKARAPLPLVEMTSPSPTILIAGVSVIDFVFDLDELPRAAEKYRARGAAIVGGGCAANAAVAVARLGGHAMLASRLGEDEIGEMIVSGLTKDGVDCTLVRRFEGRRSSFSSIFVTPDGERQIVNYRDMELSFDAGWLAEGLPDRFDVALADTRWAKGAAVAMQAARQRGVPGVLDAEAPVREADEALRLASHVAFSAQGLRDLTGAPDIETGLRQAAAELDGWVCVTDGADGVLYLERDRMHRIPAFAIEAIDTLGAGDVWHGAFALRLAELAAEPEAIRFANAVAAIKCTRFGGRDGTPTRAETERFLAERG